ncbi:hypothetical protein DICPUDRAFT_78511 [Dictyostelium purpureum]|uniref:FNIP repeat-containing protein n=1 Tax=Dictyostelium purpureum TaxID=5786 RepID=F0ZJS0_DICPU|nr:uncharacterized protein DICPUDRAFT_78511 [Dictyostelium purpureum]EGC35829.1 hypothetical protein DICPUDRAFT_78511 [Dictyostelium purpureum]|eukprot:XP_003287666.1 hypothetical protein DICPUDRAFT_78511 [Dictyostelium purpureum]
MEKVQLLYDQLAEVQVLFRSLNFNPIETKIPTKKAVYETKEEALFFKIFKNHYLMSIIYEINRKENQRDLNEYTKSHTFNILSLTDFKYRENLKYLVLGDTSDIQGSLLKYGRVSETDDIKIIQPDLIPSSVTQLKFDRSNTSPTNIPPSVKTFLCGPHFTKSYLNVDASLPNTIKNVKASIYNPKFLNINPKFFPEFLVTLDLELSFKFNSITLPKTLKFLKLSVIGVYRNHNNTNLGLETEKFIPDLPQLEVLILGKGFDSIIKPLGLGSRIKYLSLSSSFKHHISLNIIPENLKVLQVRGNNTTFENDLFYTNIQCISFPNGTKNQIAPAVSPSTDSFIYEIPTDSITPIDSKNKRKEIIKKYINLPLKFPLNKD